MGKIAKLFFLCGLISNFFAYAASNDDMFTREKILEILSKETILYYADGQTQLGSLFGREHRLYITIDRIPQIMKDAIISAEDDSFYTNMGIDPKSIARAAIHNIFYGTRQGASTITQQTVKNLYGRSETNITTKFQEMLNAFKLEKKFTKDQILEFYLNQFHVTGNGRGVGIAAKYYFNKNIEDLNLVEAAFIAGSVKGPEKYNPFTKPTADKQAQARAEAFVRKNYVLERMLKSNKITEDQYNIASKEQVPFKQGKFQFNELSINQIVQRQLGRPEILKALGVNTVDEIGSKGFHITTTLDYQTQRAAQYGLKQNLSRVQMILNGFSNEPSSRYINIQSPELYSFYTGKIDSKFLEPHQEYVSVSLGVQKCTINTEGIQRVAIILDQVGRIGFEKSKAKLLNDLKIGDYVLVSIKNINPDSSLICDLETYPRVQGGAIAIDKGQILALVGGFSANEYNRAVFAQRQPGSTFKVPVYYASLQLGWSILDTISNIRDVFVWQKQFYYPRPDHKQTSLETTIAGAGARSENVASIWLLRHLTDKMTYAEYANLLNFLKIIDPNENIGQTLQNIVNKFNASPYDEFNLREGILEKLKEELTNDPNIIQNPKLKIFARTLHYGTGFDREREKIQKSFVIKTKADAKEKAFRLNTLKNNILRWQSVADKASVALENIKNSNSDKTLGAFAISEQNDKLIYWSEDPWRPEITSNLVDGVTFRPVTDDHLRAQLSENPALFKRENIYLDGVVPLALLDNINSDLEEKYEQVSQLPILERLYWNADFRYSVGMYYIASMVNGMGVQTALDWVPSFPLGSNTISLAELALVYQTMLTGKLYKFYNNTTDNQLLIIKRIEDENGHLIWEHESREFQYVDSFYSTPILNVLRNVVLAGTGYALNWEVILRSNNPAFDRQLTALKIRVPNFGKTGTTNDHTNGTYVGFLPYPVSTDAPLSPNNAITIATYIGYDTNESMQKRGYRVYGGAAIPAWEEIALGIIKSKNYIDKYNWQGAFQQTHDLPFNYGEGVIDLTVPVNSNIHVSKYGAQDDNDLLEKNIYLNDYSDNGQNFLSLHLNGDLADNVFVPKRKVSFFTKKDQIPEAQRVLQFNNLNTQLEINDED